MANKFRIFLAIYLLYIRLGAFLPCKINLKTLSHLRSLPWSIYSVLVAITFVLSQIFSYLVMAQATADILDMRDLHFLTQAISYSSVLIITTAITVRQVTCHDQIFDITHQLFELIRRVHAFRFNDSIGVRKSRNRLYRGFILKVLYFEVMSVLLFLDGEKTGGAFHAEIAVKSNLWMINIMTTLYVGAFLVIIYHFKVLNMRVTAISGEVRLAQSHHHPIKSRPRPADLSFRFCDEIDEIASLHVQLRRLARQVQRLFQPLLLLTFIYHWCDFIVQAYLWYITYAAQGGKVGIRDSLHYLTAILLDLIDVVALCTVIHATSNVAAETGLMLQKFNEFDVDQRLDKSVSE